MEVEQQQQQQQPVNLRALNLSRISQSTIQGSGDEDYYGGLSGRSIEFCMRECQELNEFKKKHLQIEQSIIDYLKALNIKMKTDPKAKQDRYYQNLRNNTKRRAYTSLEIERDFTVNTPDPLAKKAQFQLEGNPIVGRRKTQLSVASTNQSFCSTPMIQIMKCDGNILKRKSQDMGEMDDVIQDDFPF